MYGIHDISVFLCVSVEEAMTAFTRILGKRNGLGTVFVAHTFSVLMIIFYRIVKQNS